VASDGGQRWGRGQRRGSWRQDRRQRGRGLRARMESVVEPGHTVARCRWPGWSRRRGVDRCRSRVGGGGQEHHHKWRSRLSGGGGPVRGWLGQVWRQPLNGDCRWRCDGLGSRGDGGGTVQHEIKKKNLKYRVNCVACRERDVRTPVQIF
jgi:hypothetical protein